MPHLSRIMSLSEFREEYADPSKSLKEIVHDYTDMMLDFLERKNENIINRTIEIE